MATTIKKIIKKMMQKGGIITKTMEPAADEISDAVDAINAMLSSWSNSGLFVSGRTWETFNLVGNQSAYTIGTGGNFNTKRPVKIIASTVQVGQTTQPIYEITDELYVTQIPFKTTPGIPQYYNYDNAYPLANIRLYPVPSSNFPIFLLTEKPLAEFGINDPFDLPPGWERMIVYNGAIEILPDYGQEPPASVIKIAQDSLRLVQKAVARNRCFDANPSNPDSGNIYTGWNNGR